MKSCCLGIAAFLWPPVAFCQFGAWIFYFIFSETTASGAAAGEKENKIGKKQNLFRDNLISLSQHHT